MNSITILIYPSPSFSSCQLVASLSLYPIHSSLHHFGFIEANPRHYKISPVCISVFLQDNDSL